MLKTIDEFKEECKIKHRPRTDFIERWKILKLEQEKYSDRYKPKNMYRGPFGITNGNCPNCKNKLERNGVSTDNKPIQMYDILFCKDCGYEYAICHYPDKIGSCRQYLLKE